MHMASGKMWVPDVHGGQKWVFKSLELELEMTVGHYEDAGKQTQVLRKNNKSSLHPPRMSTFIVSL